MSPTIIVASPLTHALVDSISISVIWALAKNTSVLSEDPILWFAMMLMPVGPPALKLTALADVTGSDDKEKMSIAKFLTVCYSCLFGPERLSYESADGCQQLSYIISPILTFPVVAAITATQNALGS